MASDAAREDWSEGARRTRARPGLSGRLLVLTIGFVMLAEVLIYVPSIAAFRRNWLTDRIAAAQIAALVLEAAPAGTVPQALQSMLLEQVGALSVAVRSGGARRLLAAGEMPGESAMTVDLRELPILTSIAQALATLVDTDQRYLRVVGAAGENVEFVEIVLDQAPLRAAMLRYSVNVLALSLFISAVTAGLVYLALVRLIVAPVRRLTSNIVSFQQNPEDVGRAIRPSGRADEIGRAEAALSQLEETLAGELREKKHLAALGLAVSKINHDLRNMLSSAQLFSDRLAGVADPTVQRLAPKLMATLDRAIGFCQSTLAYGRAAERPPARAAVDLASMVDELAEVLGTAGAGETGIRLLNEVPVGLLVQADPEHLFRILSNLGRNAVQALERAGTSGEAPRVVVSALRLPGAVAIEIADNGPGIPARVRGRLFEAFVSSAQVGGAGLGLAIAAELVRAHGGTINLVDAPDGTPGARFRITLPDTPTPRDRA
jgi:signal transduction histidine kinase